MNTNQVDFLTAKQQLFCDEYLVDMNATAAALRAGYSSTTALNGSLMRLPKIKQFLEQRIQTSGEKAQHNRELLLDELTKIALGNMGSYFDADGCAKPMYALSEDEKSALWYVKVNADGSVVYKMHNKLAAIEKIAKLLQLYLPEVKEPKTEYVYVDRKSICADDRFEDLTVDEPELPFEEAIAFCDEQGNTLYEGPIPYGPMAEVFVFDMQDSPAEMLNKLSTYEQVKPAVVNGISFSGVDIRLELASWLQNELAECGCEMRGFELADVYRQFRALRAMSKRGIDVGQAA
ncbi:MAG: terminase small subunit [Mucilaginibacter sp.]|uniref:terminase small subunit n=1 Tax=Mucilaginibacter sp. TaxID=1882438 RepID=UPI003265978B